MTSNHPEELIATTSGPVFRIVGENLYRLEATGGYYGLLKRGGKQFRRSLKTKDRKLAERRLSELKAKVGNLTLSDESRLSFEEVAKRWLDGIRHRMKAPSAQRRETCIKALKPFFDGVAVRNITRAHCDTWLTKRGSKIAPQTFAHELGTLKGILDYCVERGLAMVNSAESIKRKRIIQAKIAIPSKEEFPRLVQAIRLSDGRADSQARSKPGADLVELLAYSGMRLREATSLTWQDVNFAKGTLTVTGGEHGTKNGDERVIPMTAALNRLLGRMRAEQEQAPPEAEVSLIKDAKTTLRKACAKLKLPGFTHHDFRHFFATSCIEAGVDIPTVSRWLGHKDGGALAMRVYGHLREEHSRTQIAKVSFEPDTALAQEVEAAEVIQENRQAATVRTAPATHA